MAIATQTRGCSYTEDELMRLPRDGRKWELVDGELKEVPTSVRHDAIVMLLGFLLYPFIRGRGVLTASQAGFWMTTGNLRSPDVGFTRKERLPDGKAQDKFGVVAPDLCIEIISPSEETADMLRKVEEYFASGAEQVWHMFPEMQTLIVFKSPTDSTLFLSEEEIDGGSLLPGFRSQIKALFEVE